MRLLDYCKGMGMAGGTGKQVTPVTPGVSPNKENVISFGPFVR